MPVHFFPLSELSDHATGLIQWIHSECPLPIKKKLLALGFTQGTTIRVLRRAPLGCPLEIQIGTHTFFLRKSEAAQIEIMPIDQWACDSVERHE